MKLFKNLTWKDIVLNTVGFVVTIIATPFFATLFTYILFPKLKFNFIQLFWIFFCIWMSLNYVVITIENSINKLKKGEDK